MKKTFSLLPILKIREYKEYVELQNFAKVAQNDMKLAVEYNSIEIAVRDVTAYMQRNVKDFETMRDLYRFLSSCEMRKRDITAQREKLKPAIDEARAKYIEFHKEAEVLRIARDTYNVSYKAYVTKKNVEELQERKLCRK